MMSLYMIQNRMPVLWTASSFTNQKEERAFVFPIMICNAVKRCSTLQKESGREWGGILVITEGVFGMSGDLGNLPG